MIKNKTVFIRAIFILCACVIVGGTLAYIKIPAGWLLGSTLVSVICSVLKINITIHNKIRSFFSIIVGLAIAGSVNSDSFALIEKYHFSIILITTSILVMWLANYLYFRKQSYDTNSSLLASLPGGMSSSILLADSLNCNKNLVALSQIVRYITSIFVFPICFYFFFLFEFHDHEVPTQPFVLYPILPQLLLIIALYALLLLIGRVYKFTPIIFAIFVGFFIYATGLVDIKIDSLVRIIAQIFLGWYAGSQINIVKHETKKMFWVSLKAALISVIMAVFFAFIGSFLLGISLMNLLLALAPGGSDAMTFLALAFNLDVLFVSIHQVIRILILNVLVGFLGSFLTRKKLKQKH
ncbi:MAG: AbrB family transcriptional regulator [Alphaproteobacteria bacterium]|jgi:membrane AbrB-like protein|nr:AbrB family transcriptional regulator [Alphaproteobacteria bacterium]